MSTIGKKTMRKLWNKEHSDSHLQFGVKANKDRQTCQVSKEPGTVLQKAEVALSLSHSWVSKRGRLLEGTGSQ